MENRPNPDTLLRRAQEEEQQAKRGKLKIYLGASPGVGKTYAMLQDALTNLKQGLDVIVGIVESHGREEIKKLLQGFEIIPRQTISYHEKEILELDLDAVLKRNPALVLIDEMAHSNVPGVRHTKRWQDIKEILDRGIDVYTTLNVQHVESLNDAVSQIIHSRIKETVPDFMLEMADIIELIDLPPEDLLKRLREGKVYFKEQAALASENFFRKGNLTALRELALRITAERVSEQVLLYRQGQGIKYIWPTRDKILICVGTNSASAKIVRSACRLARHLQAECIAIHVETPKLRLSPEENMAAMNALRLAERLGAYTQILGGQDIVRTIMSFAREQNVTQIVMGKRHRPRWQEVLFSSLADELLRQSGEIDVYFIQEEASHPSSSLLPKTRTSFKTYAMSVGMVATATLLNSFLYAYLPTSNLIMVYLLAVTIVALFGEIGPSILASILSVLSYRFFFSSPFYTFMIHDLPYLFTLLVMLVVSYTISHLTILNKKQIEIARLTAHRTTILHTLSQRLARTRGIANLLQTALLYLNEIFNCEGMVLIAENETLIVKAFFGNQGKLSEKEQSVAKWVYDLGQMAGRGTDNLPYSQALYVPLLASKVKIGVLRLNSMQVKEQSFTDEEIHLIEACANQIALAMEIDYLQDQIKNKDNLDKTND